MSEAPSNGFSTSNIPFPCLLFNSPVSKLQHLFRSSFKYVTALSVTLTYTIDYTDPNIPTYATVPDYSILIESVGAFVAIAGVIIPPIQPCIYSLLVSSRIYLWLPSDSSSRGDTLKII